MRWEGRQASTNVEDRRRLGPAAIGLGGGVGTLLLIIFALAMGVDPRQLININQPGANAPQGAQQRFDPEEERAAEFSKVVLHDTEVVWDDQFSRQGQHYEKPVLVLFSGATNSGCGFAESAVGPFYCPDDDRVYLDLSFFHDMQRKLDSPGDFARAYVIAHEVGHHVQRQLGYYGPHAGGQRMSAAERNRSSVRLELQADFLAGVWAHHAQEKFNFLQAGDVESALHAAFAIGDDRLQKQSRGYVVPDSFTHGTSQQRMRWFLAGFRRGDLREARKLFELPYDQL